MNPDDEMMYTPDEWAPPVPEGPHDHKGYSEEKCTRCGWVMGHQPLNCNNDDTPHVFPSQLAEIDRLEGQRKLRADIAKLMKEERDAERSLASQLAVALAAQGSASFDEDTNLRIKRLALDAFKEARREQ